MYKKHKRSYWVKAFMISYAAAFLVLGLFAFLTVEALKPQQSEEYRAELSLYLPEAEDKRTVLLLLLDEKDELLSCSLVSFNALRQEIPVTTLPPQTAASCFGERLTLNEIFRDGGMGRVKDGIEESFGVKVDGCVQLDSESLPAAVDIVGPLEFYLPYTLKSGTDSSEISEGVQLMNGQLMYKLLAFENFHDGEEGRCKLISEVVAAYIDKYLPKTAEADADTVFKNAVSKIKTDISFREFEEFKEALNFLNSLSDSPGERKLTYTVTASGVFSKDLRSFEPAQSFLEKLGALM